MMSDHSISDPQSSAHHLIRRVDSVTDGALPADELDQEVGAAGTGSLAAYLHAFRRRWFVALSLGTLCAVAAGAMIWTTSQDQYTATVHFRLAATPESLIFSDASANRGGHADDYEIFKNTQQQLVRTDYVIKAALRPEAVNQLPIVAVQEDADRWLAEQITTRFPNEGELMNLSITAGTADQAALLTASVAKAYIDEVVMQETKNRSRRLAELKSTLREKTAERETKNAELRELAKTLGSKDTEALSNQQRVAQDHWMAVYREWIQVQNEVTRLQTNLELKQAELKRAQAADAPALQAFVSPYERVTAHTQDPILTDLRFQLTGLRQALEEAKAKGTATTFPRYEQELKETQQLITERQQELEQDLGQRSLAMLADQVAQTTSELDTQTRLEERLRKDEQRLRDSVKEFGGSSLIVESLQKEIEGLDRIIDPMDTQVRELEIELRRPNRVTRMTRLEREEQSGTPVNDADLQLDDLATAIRPNSSDSNRKVQKAAAAGVAMFGLVVGGILFLDLRTQRVNSSVDVSNSLGLPVIGAVPLIPNGAIRGSRTGSHRYRRYRTLMTEAMRGVMVRLLHDTPATESRVIFVSSASSGEGKSTLATNLGVAMARAGYRTLLVDSDLRRPSLNELFDLPTGPGISEILRHQATLDETIRQVDTANLSLLSAGRWSPHDVSLLANGTTEEMFSGLRDRFQYVIVDSAPILGVAESQLLCRHADTVLMSIFRDVSSGPEVLAACETLANFGVRSICAVVTGTSNLDHKHYYSDYGLEESEESEK